MINVSLNDVRMEFTRAGGPGGQHRNKTESAVRLTHLPTGIVALASERRSQFQNRALAFERLAAKIAALSVKPVERIASAAPEWVETRRREEKVRNARRREDRRVEW